MRHHLKRLQQQSAARLHAAKEKLAAFRIYNLASYALNRATPHQGYQLKTDLAYGDAVRQKLDLYLADQKHAKKPLLVFVHGGAWSTGDKSSYRFFGQAFASQGFDVAVINYHLAPEYIYPASVNDLALALNFLHDQQEALQVSTEHVILMGHSAGAFNVMSVLYSAQQHVITCFDNIRAVIGLAGPYHFDYKGDPLCQHAFDQTVSYRDVMPYYFVEQNNIQHYLFRAANDTVVGSYNADDLQIVLHQVGNHCEIIEIAKTGHVTLVGSLAHWFQRYFRTYHEVSAVLQRSLADQVRD